MYSLAKKIINYITELGGYLGAFAILIASIIITYEVIFRYLVNRPTVWEIEAAVFLLLFASFICGAYGLKKNAHIKVEIITNILGPKKRALLEIFTDILSLFFCLCLAYTGWPMWWISFKLKWISESLWGPPLWIPYLFLPIGITIFCLQYLVKITDSISNYKAIETQAK